MDLPELLEIGERERASRLPVRIRCCVAAGCVSSGSKAVLDSLNQAVEKAGLAERVQVCAVGCLRLCCRGPLVQVDPENTLYQNVTSADAPALVRGELGGDKRGDANSPFFALQASVILENSGKIEPERIESYLAAHGYQGLHQALREMTPPQVVDTVTRSGLRGRGGAGYPTGIKWGLVAKSKGERKYVVCNADEGDPGAIKNRRSLLLLL